MRVLIVDDDPIALELLRETLADAGHEVRAEPDGRAALAALNVEPFDVVISDWEMPHLGGPDLCRAIREGAGSVGGGGYVYVILLTVHQGTAQRIAGLSAGADEFMSKPFDPAELLVRMRAAERIVSLETRDVAIFALAKLAESRDPETGAHLERVTNYCRILAQHLAARERYAEKIDGAWVRLLHATSPLHDIGKVGIPDTVLLKPGRLSEREFEIMKEHTTIGAATLDAALRRFPKTPFLRMARNIALTHHERYDGTGYPNHLKGDEIPLCGRIVALADVYDALSSKRVYKDAFSHDIAKSLIVKESGSHFDPDVVEAFLEAESAFVAVRERFKEGNDPGGGAALPLMPIAA